MSDEITDNRFLTTKEVAGLLRIKERKVYDLAAEEQIPCTRATGKLLFSRTAINQWLAEHSVGHEQSSGELPTLFCGSHDPLLEWAIRESRCNIPALFDGSLDGLNRVLGQQAGVSAIHIYDPESDGWNEPVTRRRVQSKSVVLVRWVVRQRGIVTRQNTTIKTIKDFANHKVVNRQPGAGSQLLFEHLLKREALSESNLDIVITARSEADLVLAVAQENADCGLGLANLARHHALKYIPLVDEQLDLLVDRRFWFEPSMQTFINFCRSQTFLNYVESLYGYQCDGIFEVRYNS